jgi:hypothetical protein
MGDEEQTLITNALVRHNILTGPELVRRLNNQRPPVAQPERREWLLEKRENTRRRGYRPKRSVRLRTGWRNLYLDDAGITRGINRNTKVFRLRNDFHQPDRTQYDLPWPILIPPNSFYWKKKTHFENTFTNNRANEYLVMLRDWCNARQKRRRDRIVLHFLQNVGQPPPIPPRPHAIPPPLPPRPHAQPPPPESPHLDPALLSPVNGSTEESEEADVRLVNRRNKRNRQVVRQPIIPLGALDLEGEEADLFDQFTLNTANAGLDSLL